MNTNKKMAEKLRYLTCRQLQKVKRRSVNEVVLLKESLGLTPMSFAQ